MLDLEDAVSWFQGALGELYATVAAQNLTPSGQAGGIFASDLFTHERGEATIYLPCDEPIRPTGRVAPLTVPAVELAVISHWGPHHNIDRAYGELGSYVAEHALSLDGPLHEFYVVGARETADQSLWHTEIGWPIFHTGPEL
jgi:effector-binding domain-containing protein